MAVRVSTGTVNQFTNDNKHAQGSSLNQTRAIQCGDLTMCRSRVLSAWLMIETQEVFENHAWHNLMQDFGKNIA